MVWPHYWHLEAIPHAGACAGTVPVRGALRLATTLTEQRERALLFRELATLQADARIKTRAPMGCAGRGPARGFPELGRGGSAHRRSTPPRDAGRRARGLGVRARGASVEAPRANAYSSFRRSRCAGRFPAGSPPLAGRPRVVSSHRALADVGLDVLVAERDVVPARVTNLVGEDRRRAVRPLPLLVEEAVRHRQVTSAGRRAPGCARAAESRARALPSRGPRRPRRARGGPWSLRSAGGSPGRGAPRREVVAIVDRRSVQRVVVAGQDDDRLAQPRELGPY